MTSSRHAETGRAVRAWAAAVRYAGPVLVSLFLMAVQAGPAQAEKVVLQLCWDHQFQFAGYYAALWRGYYAEAGLDVEIRRAMEVEDGKYHFVSATQEVIEGRADFGVGSTNILVARDAGAPLVVLAPIFQHSAVELYSRQEDQLSNPVSMTGKTILRRKGDLGEVEMSAMFMAEGVNPSDLTFKPLQKKVSSAESLRNGTVDMILGYSLTTPYLLDKADIKYSVLRPAMYGVDFYGDSLFTSESLVRKNSPLIEAFTNATLRGWVYALSHSEEIARRIAEDMPRVFRPLDDLYAFNMMQAQSIWRLCNYPQEAIGHNNPQRWHRMHDYLREAGLVSGKLDSTKAFYDPARWKQAQDERFHNILYITMGILLGCAALLSLWVMSLRQVVEGRTADLVEANEQLHRQYQEQLKMQDALRESEERYRIITENLPLGVLLLDADRHILAGNTTMRHWFPEVDFGAREHCYKLMGRKDPCPYCPCVESDTANCCHIPLRVDIVVRDEKRRFRIMACPVDKGDAERGQYIVIYSDVTDEELLNERLNKAKKFELVATMSGGIAHEVSQPLNALKLWITGLLMLMDREGEEPPMEIIRDKITKVRQAADKIALVINHMRMLINRSDEKQVEPTNLNDCVRRALSLLNARMASHGVALRMEVEEGGPVVAVNPIQLEQVVINLVANAIDALDGLDRTDKCVEVATGVDVSREVAFLVVEDNGPGFNGDGERMFDPFYTTKLGSSSMGLGLSLVQSFITSWGGVVTAGDSSSLGGARMRAELPLAHSTAKTKGIQ